jgi:uncharacterized protein (TIGR02722 family)
MKKLSLLVLLMLSLVGCSSFKAQRVDRTEGDEKALSITDKWVQRDTEDAVKDLIKQMERHPSFQDVLKNSKKKLKIFIAEVQNETSEPYFPIRDINDELLNEFSYSGKFTLVDAEARGKLLKEIQYQNDGMVDPAQAKSIGKQFGADVLVLGSVRMQPESRDGKTIKQYSINLRMTNLETSEEILRIRFKTSKYSEQSKTGW